MNHLKTCRYRDLKPGGAYYEKWRRLYIAEISVLVPIFAMVVIALPFAFVVDLEWFQPYKKEIDITILAMVVVLGLFAVFAYLWLGSIHCPRCGKSYYRTLPQLTTGMHCGNCQLPKWAPDDPEKGVP